MHFPANYEYPNAPYFAEYLQFDADANLLEVFDQVRRWVSGFSLRQSNWEQRL